MIPSYNLFVFSLEINCYFWGFWKTSRIYSKEFLHTKYLAICYSGYTFQGFPSFYLFNPMILCDKHEIEMLFPLSVAEICDMTMCIFCIFHAYVQFRCCCTGSMPPYRDMLYKYITECVFGCMFLNEYQCYY